MIVRFLILSIPLLLLSLGVHAESFGSLYVSKLKANVSWEGNSTGANRRSVFEIIVDGDRKQPVSVKDEAMFEKLELGKRHSVTIKLDGKAIESFFFRFEDYPCDRLWLYYKEVYGTWSLRMASYTCKRK